MRDEDAHREKVRKMVKARKKFYQDFYVFLGMAAFYLFFNFRAGFRFGWLGIVLFFYAIHLAATYVKAFGVPGVGLLDEEWEAREVERELERMTAKKNSPAPNPKPSEDDEPGLELRQPEQQPVKRWKDDELV